MLQNSISGKSRRSERDGGRRKRAHRHYPSQAAAGHPRWTLGSLLAVLVLTPAIVVHSLSASAHAETAAQTTASPSAVPVPPAKEELIVPPAVGEMVDAILAAVRSGNIDDLRIALDWNELPPEISEEKVEDPIAFWKSKSADGEGREILAVLANILALPPARVPEGKDLENNGVFVWPYLAEAELDKLTPAAQVDLLRLVPAATAKDIREKKSWIWWRLAIGADGTWHSFIRRDK